MLLKGKIEKFSSRTAWVQYKETFELEIRLMTRAHGAEILESCQVRTWNPSTASYMVTVDGDKYYEAIGRDIVRNWRGLTPEILRTLVDMKEYPAEEVPYSPEDAAELLSKANGLDQWVQNVAKNMEFFEAARRAAETKNS